MRKKSTNKKKQVDYSIFVHIFFAISFIAFVLVLYFVGGQKDVNTVVKTTENLYKEKMEMTEQIKPENVISKKQKQQVSLKDYEKYSFRYAHTINIPSGLAQINLKVPIPSDEVEKQYISSLKITPNPTKTYFDGRDNVAEFILQNPKQGKFPVVIEGIASLRGYDFYTAQKLGKNISKEKDLSQYLKSEKLIESDDPYIKNIAAKIQGNTRDEIVQNIYVYLQNNITYKPLPMDIGAKAALQQKIGKCSEYAVAMIAICRAKNIPARFVSGKFAREQYPKHSWVEVYYDEYGWVTYDPTARGAVVLVKKPNGQVVKKEQKLDSRKLIINYIAASRRILASWSLSYAAKAPVSGPISVTDDFDIKKID